MRKPYGESISVAVLTAGLFVAGRAMSGRLRNSMSAPAPTMHTLEDIYQKVNHLVIYTNATAVVAKTGQTTSYQVGDDGDYKKGVAWPNPRFTASRHQVVLDNLTGPDVGAEREPAGTNDLGQRGA